MAELLVQRCIACQHRMFPSRLACSECGGSVLALVPAGEGRVLDRVEILRSPGLAPDRPLVLLRVELAGGPRLVAGTAGAAARGDAVTVTVADGALTAGKP
ncbi:hypothetical protein BH09ACT5_BH09ACT5_05880 [soil metagenome]